MASSEATRRWQAESLAKRLLEEDDYTAIAAAAFDLGCHQEFEEAISTLSSSKDRQIKRACADGFAEFAGQVDAALENTAKVEKARQVLLSTSQTIRAALQATQKQQDAIHEAERSLTEVAAQRNEVEMCIRWLRQRKQIEALEEGKDYPEALKLVKQLLEEMRLYPNSHFAKSISPEPLKIQITQKCEQELNQWMVQAMDRGRELGFAKLARDVGYTKRSLKVKISDGDAAVVDKTPVTRFFAVHRKDYAEEQYSNHRLPALNQTISALSRATTASAAHDERAVRFRNSFAEICGFFMIEQVVGALSRGEMAEVWAECCSKLVEALKTGFPRTGVDDKMDEIAETIACDVARTCLWVGLDAPDVKEFLQSRVDQIKNGWMARSLSLVRDYCNSSFNKRSSGGDSDDAMLPFCVKSKQEMVRALTDAAVLERFLGSFKLGLASNNEQSFERGCIDKALREVLAMSENNLDDALFVYRAARELGSESPASKESFFETETLARERIEYLFVGAKVDRLIRFEYPQDYLPPLNASTRLEPHACITQALHEIERAFSQDPTISTGEMNHIPREVRSSLLAETMGRLADVLDKWILKDSHNLNPLSLKLFLLDLLAVEQYFPDHSERFSPLITTIQPFCVEGALELALLEASQADKERFALVLSKFKELDSSSRLFGPPALKKKIVDLREHEAKRYLSQLKVTVRG